MAGKSLVDLARKRQERRMGAGSGSPLAPSTTSSTPTAIPIPHFVEAANVGGQAVTVATPHGEGPSSSKRKRVAEPPIVLDGSQGEYSASLPDLGSVWENPLSEAFDKLVLTDEDKARLVGLSVNDARRQAQFLEKYCLRAASGNPKHRPSEVAAEVRGGCSGLGGFAPGPRNGDQEKDDLIQDLGAESRAKAAVLAEKKELERSSAEASAGATEKLEKMRAKALKHKKEDAEYLRSWENSTISSFKNAIGQLQHLNPGGLTVRGDDSFYEVVNGRLCDIGNGGTEVDLS